ncbi:MAG: cytochrome c biogenesis protein CcdA [Deltaproteobacteria bacterium]|nr:cytochrome c biogenesis protein CcdA [Deltaproteobacteria bacterium]
MESTHISFFAAFAAGLGSFLTPCVLPLIPSYITYITGLSFTELKEEHPSRAVRKKAAIHSLLFIAGFTTVFMTIAASFAYLGGFFQGNADLIRKVGGILVIIFGIQVTGLIHISALLGDMRIKIRNKPAGYLGTFVVGLAFAVGWTPCTGPILGAILTVATTEGKIWNGMLLLLSYSLGLGTPFFLSSLSLSGFLVLFNKYKKFIRLFEITTGILLIIVGILIFTNYLQEIGRITSLFR